MCIYQHIFREYGVFFMYKYRCMTYIRINYLFITNWQLERYKTRNFLY